MAKKPEYAKAALGPNRLKRTGAGAHLDKRFRRARTRAARRDQAVRDNER
ncbi:hypothetical protein GCM10009810_34230 [Nostocoides vanveenii]|uniref:Uncharacterized protein n=1 Tax=Nostocoides vanveenii TaxID=330835 RepID=A0ABP4XDE2_9MICO